MNTAAKRKEIVQGMEPNIEDAFMLCYRGAARAVKSMDQDEIDEAYTKLSGWINEQQWSSKKVLLLILMLMVATHGALVDDATRPGFSVN